MIPLPDAMSMLGAGLVSTAGVAFLASLGAPRRGKVAARRASLALALIGLLLVAAFAPRIAH